MPSNEAYAKHMEKTSIAISKGSASACSTKELSSKSTNASSDLPYPSVRSSMPIDKEQEAFGQLIDCFLDFLRNAMKAQDEGKAQQTTSFYNCLDTHIHAWLSLRKDKEKESKKMHYTGAKG